MSITTEQDWIAAVLPVVGGYAYDDGQDRDLARALWPLVEPLVTRSQEVDLATEVIRLKRRIQAVRALHERNEWNGCLDCGSAWPCPTILALDGDERTDG